MSGCKKGNGRMVSYGEMQSTIADEMANDGAITTQHIKNAILRSIRDY